MTSLVKENMESWGAECLFEEYLLKASRNQKENTVWHVAKNNFECDKFELSQKRIFDFTRLFWLFFFIK